MKRLSLVTAIISVFMLAGVVSGEPHSGDVGRLRDGRAYRIDSQGMQLIDELAENEMTIRELRQQIAALQDETVAQQRTIDQLRHGGSLPAAQQATASQTVEKIVERKVIDTAAIERAVASERQSLGARISELESQLSRERVLQGELARREAAARADGAQMAINQENMKLGELKSELSRLNAELVKQDATISELNSQLAAKEAELKIASVRENELSKQAKSYSDQVRAKEEQLARAKLSSELPIAAISTSREDSEQEKDAEVRNELAPESIPAAKRELQRQLASIQSQIMERKSLADEQRSQGSSVSVNLSPLKTRSGVSLDALRLSVSELNTDSDLDGIQRGLAEIQSVLGGDIATLGRLHRLH